MRGNQLAATGVAALVQMPRLRSLNFFANRRLVEGAVGDAEGSGGWREVAAAIEAGGGAALTSLDLGACGLEASVAALCAALRSGGAPGLSTLELFGNGVGSARLWHPELEALRAARPVLDVAWRAPTEAQEQEPADGEAAAESANGVAAGATGSDDDDEDDMPQLAQ